MAHDSFHLAFPVRDLAGTRATMFLLDPSGNALELKAYRDPSAVSHR